VGPEIRTYGELTGRHLPDGKGNLRQRVARHLGLEEQDDTLDRFEWLGLFEDRPLPKQPRLPLDLVAGLFQEKLQYAPGEQDMVVLEHHFTASRADGSRRHIVARMIVFGEAGDRSAMALTVGTPAGLACNLILDGRLSLTGVQIPVAEEISAPILEGLRQRGFKIEEIEEDLGD
jgi:saccharopine dehydrogenase (NADP+, L-glutamate forming)